MTPIKKTPYKHEASYIISKNRSHTDNNIYKNSRSFLLHLHSTDADFKSIELIFFLTYKLKAQKKEKAKLDQLKTLSYNLLAFQKHRLFSKF